MLANGITLKYGESEEAVNSLIPELKEVPSLGTTPEKVENTTLSDKVKKYEQGIGDAGELEYKLKYLNKDANSTYRKMRKFMEGGKVVFFEQEYPDGTKVKFSGQVSVEISGGGVNAVIETTLKITLRSELVFTDGDKEL
ncbi:phage tail tube protein [Granulicatella adiacens]|uniref:phage tail tube protein n=1 Tax=Granulicatella adiacens TaxID=46124 RepID=UPI0020610E0F|nr:MAG TPA: tail tube protein [Caudoviricetes sp.]